VRDNSSRSTPEKNNRSPQRYSHTTRLTLKLNCPASNNAEEMILSTFSEFVQELVGSDETAAILPWKSIHKSKKPISKATDVSKNIRLMRPYLNRFFVSKTPDSPFSTYPSIHVGHNKPISDLREDMQMWLQDGGHGLYYKMLQVEDSAEIGWLLYSTKEMDAGALVDEIAELVEIKVGLRWKVIDIGAKGKLPENQMIRALAVEVNAKHRWDFQRKLINYFGKNAKESNAYPNGIRLRFVKNKKDGINAIEKGKIERLRARQQQFLKNIVTTETWDIIQLDYSADPNKLTLRQMIMKMKSKDDFPLFHCVDLDWRGEGYVFQFAPTVKVEAECSINTLLPLLKYQYPDADVERYFSHEAIDRCDGLAFDSVKGVVIDNLVDDHLTFLDEENLLGFSFENNENKDNTNSTNDEARPATAQPLYNDSDSVSTLANPGRARFITPTMNHNATIPRPDTRNNDNASIISTTSTMTMETLSTIDQRITSLTTHVQNNDKKFEDLMNMLMASNARGSSQPITQNSTSNNGNQETGEESTTSFSGGVQ
jgi:hypothetical protein